MNPHQQTSFGPLLTPARDLRKNPKASLTFQLTIRNRLGAALKFAHAGDSNANLGTEAIKVTEDTSQNFKHDHSKLNEIDKSDYIPCPLCCRNSLPSAQFSNLIPSEQDDSACAHYMFCCRPTSPAKTQLHWHTQHCYLCQGILIEGKLDNTILEANEKYRQLERHRCRRLLSIAELDEVNAVADVWKSYSTIENQATSSSSKQHWNPAHDSQSKDGKSSRYTSHSSKSSCTSGKSMGSYSNTSSTTIPCDANEAICSLNLAHYYFMGFGRSQNEESQLCSVSDSQSIQSNDPHLSAQNMERVIKHLKRAAKFGLAAALYNLGMLCLWNYVGDEAHGVRYLRKAAQCGYVPAHYHLAIMIRDNITTAVKNDQECNRQDIFDMNHLTDNDRGIGLTGNDQRMLSDQGNQFSVSSSNSSRSSNTTVINYDATTAQLMKMGIKERKPSKSERNKTRALYLLLSLVVQGFRDSCLDAGVLLSRNISCPLNREMKLLGLKKSENCWHRAFRVWCKGAKLGCSKCTFEIGNCYKRGLGVSRSASLAFQCYSKAAAMGSEPAMKELRVLKSDDVHINQDQHYFANKWRSIERAMEKIHWETDRSEQYESIGGVGVVRDGVVGKTADIHHHYHHHQSEWQPWQQQQEYENKHEKRLFEPFPVGYLERAELSKKGSSHNAKPQGRDIWSVAKSQRNDLVHGLETVDIHKVLTARNKQLFIKRAGTVDPSQRPDFYKHKHGEVLSEIIQDHSENSLLRDTNEPIIDAFSDGMDGVGVNTNKDRMFETKFVPPNSKYQQNFQKLFGCYDDLHSLSEAEIVPFKQKK